jgi:hypothetical protein
MAGIIYKYPTNVSLDMVTQEYVAQTEKLRGEELMPFDDTTTQTVQWDELDAERGMTAPHVMGTDPKIDVRPGSSLREFEPIPFKETDLVKENELLKARQFGTIGGVVDISALIGRIARARVDKNRLRAEWTRWQAFRGQLSIIENGVHIVETFPIQQFTPTILWGDRANARILRDWNVIKVLFRGTGATAKGAVAIGNSVTIAAMLENTNPNDLAGFRNENFKNTNFDLSEANKIFAARGLPTLEENDEGYIDETGNFQTWLEDGELIIFGKRPAGQPLGKWLMTPTLHRQKNGQPAPGMFEIIEVNGMPSNGSTTVNMGQLGMHKNPKIEVTGGLYGGPVLFYPRSIIKVNAFGA